MVLILSNDFTAVTTMSNENLKELPKQTTSDGKNKPPQQKNFNKNEEFEIVKDDECDAEADSEQLTVSQQQNIL